MADDAFMRKNTNQTIPVNAEEESVRITNMNSNASFNQSSYLEPDSLLVCGTQFLDADCDQEFILKDAYIDPALEKKFRNKQQQSIQKNLRKKFDEPIEELESEDRASSVKKKDIKFVPSKQLMVSRAKIIEHQATSDQFSSNGLDASTKPETNEQIDSQAG